jgi:hypothetical protein
MSSRYGKNRVRFKNIEWIFGKKNNLHFTFLLLSITIVFEFALQYYLAIRKYHKKPEIIRRTKMTNDCVEK